MPQAGQGQELGHRTYHIIIITGHTALNYQQSTRNNINMWIKVLYTLAQ